MPITSQTQYGQQTKHSNGSLPAKEGRTRIRSHLSILDDNILAQRRSKSSTSSQGPKEGPELCQGKEVQKPESKARHGARKTTRVFRNSRPREDQTPAMRGATSSSVSRPTSGDKKVIVDTTYIVSRDSKKSPEVKVVEEKEVKGLPQDVLNIQIAEGLYEYSQEVHSYLMEREKVSTIAKDFLDNDQVTEHMRAVLVDWLTQVQHHLSVSVETLYRTVSTLDLVLSLRSVEPSQLQLVGITAMLVASKLEEYYPVEIRKLLHLTEESYTRKELLDMEKVMLKLLGFQFILPSPQSFLPRFCRAALRSAEQEFYSSCTFLLDCHLLRSSHSCLPPSHLAASAVLGSLTLYRAAVKANPASPDLRSPDLSTIWTSTLVHYTGYSVEEIVGTASDMLEQLRSQSSDGSKFSGARTKYSSRSQHNRLAHAAHMTLETVDRAMLMLGPVLVINESE